MQLRTAELFSGYGGLGLAAPLAGILPQLEWYSEICPAASAVMAHHHPGVPNLGDATTIDYSQVGPIDLLLAGFPCQPFSAAGRQRGAIDPRHLWPLAVVPAIRELRPKFVFMENVPGLRTNGGGAVFRQVLTDLVSLGYRVDWTTVGACLVGGCHHRHRLFILATFGEEPSTVPAGPYGQHGSTHGQIVGGTVCGSTRGRLLPTPLSRDSNRGAGLGDAPGRPLSEVAVALLPTVLASDGVKGGPQQTRGGRSPALPSAVQAGMFGRYQEAVEGWGVECGRSAPPPTVTSRIGTQRLSPRFCEWMMGLDDLYLTGVVSSPVDAIRLAGNGVMPQAAGLALRLLLSMLRQNPDATVLPRP